MGKSVLSDSLLKLFIVFLKQNKLYGDYMYNYALNYKTRTGDITNFLNIMRESWRYPHFSMYGALYLTLDAFDWANGFIGQPRKQAKWASTVIEWGLCCKTHNVKICKDDEFARLIHYYSKQKWLTKSVLSKDCIKEYITEYSKDNGKWFSTYFD